MKLGMPISLSLPRRSQTPTQALLGSAAALYRPASGPTFTDANGRLAAATLTNCTFVASGATYTDQAANTRTANRDGLWINATSGGIVLPFSPDGPVSGQWSAWMKATYWVSNPANGRLFDMKDATTGPGVMLQFAGAGTSTTFALGYEGGTSEQITGARTMTAGTHELVGLLIEPNFGGGYTTTAGAVSRLARTKAVSADANLTIGGQAIALASNGIQLFVSAVALFNRTLTNGEIALLEAGL